MTVCFRSSEAIEATEGICKSDGKAQVSGGSRGVRVLPRVGGGGRSLSSSGRLGGRWEGVVLTD